MQNNGKGTLFVVGTPIGNLQDISLRAMEILKSVSVIACEDTRTSRQLLNALSINTPSVAVHQHSSDTDIQQVVDRLLTGKDVALITDAGTPGVSDPGGKLVAVARQAGIPIRAIPGPSALTAALSVAGVDVSHFLFLGYMPLKGRQKILQRMAETPEAAVVFESTHRIKKLLEEINVVLGERPVVVCKELTKIFEHTFAGTAAEILQQLTSDSRLIQGEFVVIICPQGWKL